MKICEQVCSTVCVMCLLHLSVGRVSEVKLKEIIEGNCKLNYSCPVSQKYVFVYSCN